MMDRYHAVGAINAYEAAPNLENGEVARFARAYLEALDNLEEVKKEARKLRDLKARIVKLGRTEVVSKADREEGNIDLLRLHRDRVRDNLERDAMRYAMWKEYEVEGDVVLEGKIYVVAPDILAELKGEEVAK